METITSKSNDRIKFLCKLRDHGKRKRYEAFLIEGVRELSRAVLHKRASIMTVFFCESFFKNEETYRLLDQVKNMQIEMVSLSRAVFEKISNREHCDGVIALAKFWTEEVKKMPDNSFVLVAEKIEKSGNLGALIRSAESAGVDLLILCDPVTDIFNPNVVRASQGAVFSLPILSLTREETLKFLQENRINIFAATPMAEKLYFQCDFRKSTAILVGAEHDGLSEFWLNRRDIEKIALPQNGVSDSLNVNDAAVVILYEVLRQRVQII